MLLAIHAPFFFQLEETQKQALTGRIKEQIGRLPFFFRVPIFILVDFLEWSCFLFKGQRFSLLPANEAEKLLERLSRWVFGLRSLNELVQALASIHLFDFLSEKDANQSH
ncbi:MAG: hypothetical protein HY537_05530 [Deltaproteobacteria bacterium]|nr:hypothetical protein [Deltaproteobacteria bacterium]